MYRKQEVVDNRSIRVGSDDSQVNLKCGQWLKLFCEAGGGLTWRSHVGANAIPIPTPLIWRYLGVK